jgi:hypothetical protein
VTSIVLYARAVGMNDAIAGPNRGAFVEVMPVSVQAPVSSRTLRASGEVEALDLVKRRS